MKLRIDWKGTVLATGILLLLSALVNLIFVALSFPAVMLPLVMIAGGSLFFVNRSPRRRDKIRGLLQDQKRLAKSFVRCLFDKE